MKKRLFVIALVLALLVGLVVMTTTATEQGTLQAGYAAVSISPYTDGETDLSVGLPMPGYGTATDRLSTGLINDDGDDTNGTIDAGHELMATVIAVTDASNNTVLLISADTATTNQNWTNTARSRISSKTNVAYNNIFIHATGTLSAPEISYGYSYTDAEIEAMREDPDKQALYTRLTKAKAYREFVYEQLVAAAEAAMNDRSEVVMSRGELDVSDYVLTKNPQAETNQQRMAYNTHYKSTKEVDGVQQTLVLGADFGPNFTNSCTELYEPDDTLQLLQFTPTDTTKAPIVLANWNVMPNLSSTGYTAYGVDHRYKISSDYIGAFRNTLEKDPTNPENTEPIYRTAFIAGTTNNISAFHRLSDNWDPDVTEEYTAYIRPDSVSNTLKKRSSLIPTKYGQKLADAAMYALTTDGIMTEATSGKVQTMAMHFATDPNVPTEDQIALVNKLLATESKDSNYASAYSHLINKWSTAKPQYIEEIPELASIKESFELNGMKERGDHTTYSNRTDFATDAAYCELHAMMIGDEVAFVISPMEFYDSYSKTVTLDTISETGWNEWDKLRATLPGSLFIATNSNGSSSVVPNYLSASYNADSDTYATGSRDFNFCKFARGAGEDVITTYGNMFNSMTASDGDHKNYCECGGTLAKDTGHTCKEIEWLAWSDPKNLPSSGNYYLTCDVTTQYRVTVNRGTLRIDLNGHTITRKVQPDEVLIPGDDVPEKDYYANTRTFIVSGAGKLVVTDSSEDATGKITRDTSLLSEIDKQRVKNFGLLIRLETSATGSATIYAGTLDATDQYAGGGCCVSNSSDKATFTMYGGTLIGGKTDGGTVIYSNANTVLLGGEIIGGTVADSTYDDDDLSENNGAVYITSNGTLTLGGDVSVFGNTNAEGTPNNIALNGEIKIKNGYTGKAGITLNKSIENGMIIGERDSSVTDELLLASLSLDNPPADTAYSIVALDQTKVMVAELRNYCECGGTAVGKLDHDCNDITWKPWPYAASLPSNAAGGNYYLLKDVVLKSQRSISNTTIRLDLNTYDITHQVQPSTITPENRGEENTRVFSITNSGYLTITDTTADTANHGVITRDLSLLEEEIKNTITNWGLIILINQNATEAVKLYAGTLDATGMITGGGGCVANLSGTAEFIMYGGTAKGGITKQGGAIYSSGPVKLYGGLVTGGVGNSTSNTGIGVRIAKLDNNRIGKLYLAGDASVTGNVRSNGNPNNITISTGYQNFTVIGKYTGTAGISLYNKPEEAMKIGISNNADITEANLTVENYSSVDILNKDGYLILNTNAAYISTDSSVKYKSLASAIEAYPGGEAVIVLLRNIKEDDLAITKQTYLNVNGFDVNNTGFTTNGYKLYVLDSATDDYTVIDKEEGTAEYGLLNGDIATAAEGVPDGATVTKHRNGYMKIVEEDGTSFHRLNLDIIGITLRPKSVGIYYNSQFGGDEVIKRNIVAYGTALAANAAPNFKDKTYTRLSADTWVVGADKNGNSNNPRNGTLLQDILKPEHGPSLQLRNATTKVYGQSYIELADGTRICGAMASYSLLDLFVGNNITGIDALWSTLSSDEQSDILNMYNTYRNIMKNWRIPNIKAAASAQA